MPDRAKGLDRRTLESKTIALRFTGDYALADSVALAARAAFVPEMFQVAVGDPVLDLVFPLEGLWETLGVRIGQADTGVFANIVNPGKVATEIVRDRLEHMLALDVEGEGFNDLARVDKVIAMLREARRGVRPVLFPSPYEAAARAIIGHRLNVRQAATLHARIATHHGVGITIAGRTLYGFPSPARLAELPQVAGLAIRKVEQLRALGTAAIDGWLDTPRLQAMPRDAAMAHLQQLGGIGPFSAELILLRGVGNPDELPLTELRLHRAMADAYHLGCDPDLSTLHRIAETWRPYRSWVGLLLRNRRT